MKIEIQKSKVISITNEKNVYLESYMPSQARAEIEGDLRNLKLVDGMDKELMLNDLPNIPLLVIRFRKEHCNSCIQQELSIIKDLIRSNRGFSSRFVSSVNL